ncbi:hypothetical protein PTSG_00809 [Salpingoeca rosetta]|uniref:Uncharacterized protein n=1 Tax=Salpingoeca rosetta (strain ATCC 50818 / BSB-021) TaxID=946362 RepID=F2TXJ4_SALR5|nr:uncharacterized protein PTSG_00809 [Salpingoeca rosetta]EGD76103.1 hypothetical protein PTSG_00809 [Salpingoeca rosetta]|eukprot:XP_004998278.1 hypothetical protein PTSG_00809 [Salpingoeca rosetta]
MASRKEEDKQQQVAGEDAAQQAQHVDGGGELQSHKDNDDADDDGLNQELLAAARDGSPDKVRDLIRRGADVSFQEEDQGKSALMLAAEHGHEDVVVMLLERGAPWNALDRRGKCAGQYAFQNEHHDIANRILNAGVSAEMLFAAMEKKSQLVTAQASENNQGYISRPVEYKEGDLIDDEKRGVMMMWEKPLMEAHAELMCRTQGDVLNVGFGLGLVDTAIQAHSPRTHTIIEAHPDVYKKMIADGWDKRPGVKVIHARWQDVVGDLPQFDGIFFDTFDDVLHMHEFHQHLPQVLQLQLQELGFSYFENDTYHFPVVFWADAPPAFLLAADE